MRWPLGADLTPPDPRECRRVMLRRPIADLAFIPILADPIMTNWLPHSSVTG